MAFALIIAVGMFETVFNAIVRLVQKIRIGKLPEAGKPTITVSAGAELEAFLADCLPAEHPRIIIKRTDPDEEPEDPYDSPALRFIRGEATDKTSYKK